MKHDRWIVMTLKNTVELNGVDTPISTDEGICGYLPVFRTLKYAKKFAKNKYQIFPRHIMEKGESDEKA